MLNVMMFTELKFSLEKWCNGEFYIVWNDKLGINLLIVIFLG